MVINMVRVCPAADTANVSYRTTDWNTIDWKKVNRVVRNLRQRIFKAAAKYDLKRVKSLQRLMLANYSNRLQSVRKVTQINKGKNTPGVDKVIVKTPAARGRLVDQLKTFRYTDILPTKRSYIPKGKKKRPLGIPVIKDRAMQAVVKNALEPEWESRFESISYGFRPGRRTIRIVKKRLKNLTDDEKILLRNYISDKKRTALFPMSEGIAEGLVAKKILYRPSRISLEHGVFSYNIQDLAYD